MTAKALLAVCLPLAGWGQAVELGVKAGVPLAQSFETGSGGEAAIGVLQISPEFRYTRWGADGLGVAYLHSNPNRLELLLGWAIQAHSSRP